jgi:hypothetical protein
MKLEFSGQIFEKFHISYLMKIPPVGAGLFHAGGRIDMTKPEAACHNFSNAPKIDVPFYCNALPALCLSLLQSRDYLQCCLYRSEVSTQ